MKSIKSELMFCKQKIQINKTKDLRDGNSIQLLIIKRIYVPAPVKWTIIFEKIK